LSFSDDPANTQGASTPFDTPGNLVASYDFTVTTRADSFNFLETAVLPVHNTGPFSMTVLNTYTLPPGGVFLSRAIVDGFDGARTLNLGDDAPGFRRRGLGREAAQRQGSTGRDGELTRPRRFRKQNGRREAACLPSRGQSRRYEYGRGDVGAINLTMTEALREPRSIRSDRDERATFCCENQTCVL
jgi:hypothetical protein